MTPLKILMPLPTHDFDPTEAAVPWKILREAGYTVEFATPDGMASTADPLMLSGQGLDPWGWIPGLKRITLIGRMLRADARDRDAYHAMAQDAHFLHPKPYAALRVQDYDALVLPGGHAQGVKSYLGSATLQGFVADFFDATDAQGQHKPVAAICHGVVLAARSISKTHQRPVLYGRKTTALTWKLENSAWQLCKYLARFWDPHYYRTYREAPGEPVGYRGVQQEVQRALQNPSDFLDVPPDAPHHFLKASGMVRDRADDDRAAWVVLDGNYLSARWPGDAHTWSRQFVALLARYYP